MCLADDDIGDMDPFVPVRLSIFNDESFSPDLHQNDHLDTVILKTRYCCNLYGDKNLADEITRNVLELTLYSIHKTNRFGFEFIHISGCLQVTTNSFFVNLSFEVLVMRFFRTFFFLI